MKGSRTIGIVGGGQLGRMLTLAAKPLGFDVVVLDPGENGPAVQVGARQVKGDLYDEAAMQKLAAECDVVTIEIEHLNIDALEAVEKSGTPVHPSPATIRMIQDKYEQKLFLENHSIPIAESVEITDAENAQKVLDNFGGSMLLKTRHGAYDGRGNAKVSSPEELVVALESFEGKKLYAEKLVPFTKELAVMVARDVTGNVTTYPVTETIHERNICVETLTPAPISDEYRQKAEVVAKNVADLLQGAGVFGIEMFLTENGEILVNEIAPRVHNSGHYTMEGCETSQFEQHIRAITGMSLSETNLVTPAVVMRNILGERNGETHIEGLDAAQSLPGVTVHLYGKSPTKIDRKMGHINAVADDLETAREHAKNARDSLSL